jgi:hypothetical protein
MKVLPNLILPMTFLMSFMLFLGCSKDDPKPASTEMLVNGNIEAGSSTPNSWFNGHPDSGIPTVWTTDVYASASHAIKISQATVLDAADYASLGQTFSGVIPVNKDLTLSAKIKGDNLTGTGVAIAIRTDGASTPNLQFISTEGSTSITGTFNWSTYNVKLVNVSSDTKYIIVYLIYLQNTTGIVYFDDVSLTHN